MHTHNKYTWDTDKQTLYLSFGGGRVQNSLSGNRIGAKRDQMNRPAVAQLVTILTHTDGHPTSTNFPLSPTEVVHPVRSIAEYILAREKMMWKNEYEYDTGFAFSFSSCSSALSNGSRGFPAPSPGKKFIIIKNKKNEKRNISSIAKLDSLSMLIFLPSKFSHVTKHQIQLFKKQKPKTIIVRQFKHIFLGECRQIAYLETRVLKVLPRITCTRRTWWGEKSRRRSSTNSRINHRKNSG